ncbi:BolA/IbaG family iron-sulfur metabolism protein [Bradyrhizobium sp. USDA 10063]
MAIGPSCNRKFNRSSIPRLARHRDRPGRRPDYYGVRVISQAVARKSRVQRHRMAYAALNRKMDEALLAPSLQIAAPTDSQEISEMSNPTEQRI